MNANTYEQSKESLLDASNKIESRKFRNELKKLADAIDKNRQNNTSIDDYDRLFNAFEEKIVHEYTDAVTSAFNNIYNHYKSTVILDYKASLESHKADIQQSQENSWWFFSKVWENTKKFFWFFSLSGLALWVSWSVLGHFWYKKYEKAIKEFSYSIKSKFYDAYVSVADFFWFEVLDKDELIEEIDDTNDFLLDDEDIWLRVGETLDYIEAKNRLREYYLISSRAKWYNEDWSSKQKDRTCLEWLQASTIIWARELARLINNKYKIQKAPTITWWTEDWHAWWTLSHANWYKLDIRSTDERWKQCITHFWLKFGETKTITLNGQKITLYYHWAHPHLDITFHPIRTVSALAA